MRRLTCWSVFALAALGQAASADFIFTETFDGGSNVGGWSYFGPDESILPDGGNPGAFYHSPFLDTFAPQPATTWDGESVFTGNFRERGVSSVGVDLETLYVDFSAAGRKLTLMLYHDNGTPDNFSDDWAAYQKGQYNIPQVGQGWRSYDFDVPSDSETLPEGWQFVQFGPGADPDWNTVITDVKQLGFFYGDPTGFYIFQVWELGLDNPRITYIPEPAGLIAMLSAAAVFTRRSRPMRNVA